MAESNLLSPFKYAFALAIIISVSDPLPTYVLPSCAIRTVTPPRASIPSVTASTRNSVNSLATLTIELIDLYTASIGPVPVDVLV